MKTPLKEAHPYDMATKEEPLVEGEDHALPVSGLGTRARKYAIREQRCIPYWIVKQREAAAAKEEAEKPAPEKKAKAKKKATAKKK